MYLGNNPHYIHQTRVLHPRDVMAWPRCSVHLEMKLYIFSQTTMSFQQRLIYFPILKQF